MNTKNSFSFVILAGLLAAAIGLMPLASSNSVFSQTNSTSNSTGLNITMDDDMMMRDNYGKNMMGMGMGMEHKKYEKINGTLNMMETMYQAIEAKFNVTLADAITTAEQSVGNGSYAMSANGEEKDGFLVYSVILGSPDMKFTKVLVDPGNGEVLQTKNISMMEWMMMMHSQGHQDMGGMKGMHGGGSSYGQGYGGHEKGMKMNPGSGW
ncbi:PepSY domain-containing protein [Candidatus Nitrosocosmicus hydrocola]|uniref:PepSY domain-containing protein n=1 Tax=Candidatus Nitrosocosmicus hydrocola TaxID=1826872 RepID=UPI0011E5AE53|nr:PepSY domain-containing protein [Candidatus Nitrosocosmicus hydrocola]